MFPGRKTCSRCRVEKDYFEFGSNKSRHDGLTHNCRSCLKEIRASRTEAQSRYYAEWSRRKLYGLTQDQYDDMIDAQDNRCAICRKETAGKALHVDHDHETGRVRGLLCGPCNMGLGHFGDDVDRMADAIRYLKEEEA